MTSQRHVLSIGATLALSMLAACSGGGSSTPATPNAPGSVSNPVPVATSSAAPVATTTPVASTAVLATAQLAGAAGFINKDSHTVYVFDADLAAAGTSTCAGQCATVWPAIAVPAGTSLPSPFGVIARSDGTSQLTYAGRPLYTYIADSAPGSIAGNGITSFGAVWHIARPASGAATPVPGSSSPPSQY